MMEIWVLTQDVEVGYNLDNQTNWPTQMEIVSAWDTYKMAYDEKMRLRESGYKKLSITPAKLTLSK